MEQGLFLDNRRPRLVQVWLLTFCVLLCLRTGADAVKCRQCMSTAPGKPCEPNDLTCEGPYCVKIEKMSGENGEMTTIKNCGDAQYRMVCGTETKTKEKQKIHCCEADLCFD